MRLEPRLYCVTIDDQDGAFHFMVRMTVAQSDALYNLLDFVQERGDLEEFQIDVQRDDSDIPFREMIGWVKQAYTGTWEEAQTEQDERRAEAGAMDCRS